MQSGNRWAPFQHTTTARTRKCRTGVVSWLAPPFTVGRPRPAVRPKEGRRRSGQLADQRCAR
jgi:hypothetical protein